MLDVIIIGGGPAGLTAALYSGRSHLKTKLLERYSLGGQVLLTECIENFPGVYKMNSAQWVEVLKKQLIDLKDVDISEGSRVELVEKKDNLPAGQAGSFKVHVVSEITGQKNIFETRAVISAAGANPKRLGIKGEERLIGRGVSFCATCDAPFFKGKNIVVIGGGNAALEEAMYLTKFADHVVILHRRDELRAVGVLQDKIKQDNKISLKLGYVPYEIIGEAKVEGIKIKNVKTLKDEILPCDGVFVFIGASPDNQYLKNSVDFDEAGFIKTDENMVTGCPGIFAAGDCRKRPLNQVVTACSDGAVAAHIALKFLENHQ